MGSTGILSNACDAKSMEAHINLECAKFASRLANYKGDDILSEWLPHIAWLESLPEGPFVDKILHKNLADCCNRLRVAGKDSKKYFNDERFIQLWFKLAEFQPPLQIYEYMLSKEIGLQSPEFYIEWAEQLLTEKGYQEADTILCKGLTACMNSVIGQTKLLDARRKLKDKNDNFGTGTHSPVVPEVSNVVSKNAQPNSPDVPKLGKDDSKSKSSIASVENSPTTSTAAVDSASKLTESVASEPSSVKLDTFQHKKKPRDSLFMKRYDKLHVFKEEFNDEPNNATTIPPAQTTSRPSDIIGVTRLDDPQPGTCSLKPDGTREYFIWDPERVGNLSIEEALAGRRRAQKAKTEVDEVQSRMNALDEREQKIIDAENRLSRMKSLLEEKSRSVDERVTVAEEKLRVNALNLADAEDKIRFYEQQRESHRRDFEEAIETASATARAANKVLQELVVCLDRLIKDLNSADRQPVDAIITFSQKLHDRIPPLERSFSGTNQNEIMQVIASKCEEVLEAADRKRSRPVRRSESAFADVSDLNSRESTRRSDTKSSLPPSAASLSEQSNPCIKAMWNQTSIHENSRFRTLSDDGYISEKKSQPEVAGETPPVRQSLAANKVLLRTEAASDPENFPPRPPANDIGFEIFADATTVEPYLPYVAPKEIPVEKVENDDDSENTPPVGSPRVAKEVRHVSGVLNESLEHPGIPEEILGKNDFIEVPASESDTSSSDSDPEHPPTQPPPSIPLKKTCRRSMAFADIAVEDFEPESRRKSFGISDQTLPLITQSEFYRFIDAAQHMTSTPLVTTMTAETTRRQERKSRISYIPPNLSPINEGSREKSSSSSSGVSTWIKSKKSIGIYSPVKEQEEPTIVDPYSPDLLVTFKERLQEGFFSDAIVKQLPDPGLKEIDIQGTQLKLQNHRCTIEELLGKGSFSTVYSARSTTDPDSVWAVKVQSSDGWWNGYIHSETLRRLQTLPEAEQYGQLIMPLVEYQELKDGASYTFMPYCEQGTLSRLAGSYQRTSEKSMPEALALKLSTDVLRAVEALHLSNLIHGDVKASNFFLQNLARLNDPKSAKNFFNIPSVLLTDFNSGIDLSLFDDTVAFSSMKKGKTTVGQELLCTAPWTFLIDYIGVLDVMHLLLYGEPMKLVREGDTWRPTKAFKPIWHPIWQTAFIKLLNIPLTDQTPEVLTGIRKEFEEATTTRLQSTDLNRLARQIRVSFFMNRNKLSR